MGVYTADFPKSIISIFCAFILFFMGGGLIFAQDSVKPREDLWVCPGAELALFSVSNAAFGGGLTLGYGSGASIGIKTAYYVDPSGKVATLELIFLLRFYLLGTGSISGPYIQINGGPVFFAKDYSLSFPSEFGTISAGLSAGWRFLIGRNFFVEPVIRAGYPFIVGGGLYAGLHF